ncbi:MAG: hypothetical protein JWP06_660 [Candidatus Saccharibacteria bacterium]|nr:hypothetical protein [Candidatus Saccharibacteria bacterium]
MEPKYRRPLNIEQIQILELLYKFRFVTVPTVKAYFIESNPGMNVFKRLETLEQQGFIAKRYFDDYRLLHKPVAYYLLPAGARKLAGYRDEDDADEINIQGIYRDGNMREQFVTHCLAVFELYNRLMANYGDNLDFLSKSDQVSFEGFPTPLPDAYLTLQTSDDTKHFFLDVLDDDVHLLIDASKKIKHYFDYKESGSWAMTGSGFPSIVFVCNSEIACKKVQKRCDTAINKAWIRDIEFKVVMKDTISLG